MTKTYRNIYDKIDSRTLVKPDRLPQVIKIIDWVCQGYLEENFIEEVPDPDRLYEEYSEYLTLLRDHFYTREVDGTVSFAKEELKERNETVMKEMRMDMTFEERLMAGRQPLVESEEEDDKSEEDNAEKSEQAATEPSTETVREPGQPETFDDIIREAEKNIQSAGAGSGE